VEQILATGDFQIRALLKQELATLHANDRGTIIIEELGLLHGAYRADVAVVNGTMHGYELKSDRDTLSRLPEQVKAYSAVFDFVTLVVGESHLLRAIEVIPDWWGIRIARMESGKLLFRDLRLAISNVARDPLSIVRLLWRQEALSLLAEASGMSVTNSKPREWIYSELVAIAEFAYLRDAVRRYLKNRTGWRSDVIRRSCDD
jgi:hypothetical protein